MSFDMMTRLMSVNPKCNEDRTIKVLQSFVEPNIDCKKSSKIKTVILQQKNLWGKLNYMFYVILHPTCNICGLFL